MCQQQYFTILFAKLSVIGSIDKTTSQVNNKEIGEIPSVSVLNGARDRITIDSSIILHRYNNSLRPRGYLCTITWKYRLGNKPEEAKCYYVHLWFYSNIQSKTIRCPENRRVQYWDTIQKHYNVKLLFCIYREHLL